MEFEPLNFLPSCSPIETMFCSNVSCVKRAACGSTTLHQTCCCSKTGFQQAKTCRQSQHQLHDIPCQQWTGVEFCTKSWWSASRTHIVFLCPCMLVVTKLHHFCETIGVQSLAETHRIAGSGRLRDNSNRSRWIY